jgi:hypothetical protein
MPLIAFIQYASSKYGQRIGDLTANTIVVRTKKKVAVTDTVFMHLQDNYEPLFQQVMRLSDKDINSVKKVLELTQKNRHDDLALRIANKVKDKFEITTNLSPVEFLETLLKDYNFLTRNG